jgi:hypothetical protein
LLAEQPHALDKLRHDALLVLVWQLPAQASSQFAERIAPGAGDFSRHFELLTRKRKPLTEQELREVKGLAEDLGRHALALRQSFPVVRSAPKTWPMRLVRRAGARACLHGGLVSGDPL